RRIDDGRAVEALAIEVADGGCPEENEAEKEDEEPRFRGDQFVEWMGCSGAASEVVHLAPQFLDAGLLPRQLLDASHLPAQFLEAGPLRALRVCRSIIIVYEIGRAHV